MRWVYILKCEGNNYYVGETKRLYRRFWEHQNGRGCINTITYEPEEIVAIYKVNTICKFLNYNKYVNDILDSSCQEKYDGFNKLRQFNDEVEDDDEYDNLYAENNMIECLMTHNIDNWNKFRGGKYTRFDIDYNYPNNKYIKDLPLCECGLPCDVKKNEDNNYLYFRCSKKNMWDKLRNNFNIDDEPCNFFMEYTKDKKLRLEENKKFEDRKKNLKELFKKSYWLKNIELNEDNFSRQCVGGCNRTSKNIKLTYNNQKRNLCFDCFFEKNEDLKNKYDSDSELDF
jgi:predicted GIY-YIG superfamily endonuclease